MATVSRMLSALPAGDPIANPIIVIPTFNNGQYVANFIEQLQELELSRYLLFDGGSTDLKTLEFLNALDQQNRVLRLRHNPGPRHFFESKEILDALPSVFCVSDPDLRLNRHMPRDFVQILHNISAELSIGKVGLALDLECDLIDEEFFFYDGWHTIKSWEAKYWAERIPNSLGLEVFRAEIDTTFALYNKDYLNYEDFFEGVRVGGVFSATHLPWLKDNPFAESTVASREVAFPRWSTWSETVSLGNLRTVHERTQRRLLAIENSFSWKITAPLRAVARWFQGFTRRRSL